VLSPYIYIRISFLFERNNISPLLWGDTGEKRGEYLSAHEKWEKAGDTG
jgi:hypothetical protein